MKNIISLFALVPTVLFSQVQGPMDPTNAMNTSCPFSFSSPTDYLPANNVFTSNNVYATASHCDCCDMNTRCLETKGYGFTIPFTATIDGILVEVEKKGSANSNMQDNGVMLMKAGNTIGLNYATAATWAFVDTYSSYGGAMDLWGTTWLPSDINDPNFGLAFASISYTCFGNNNPVISSIDHIRIRVYYTNIATEIEELLAENFNGDFQLFTSDGRRVEITSGMLSPGIYILMSPDGNARKVVVK